MKEVKELKERKKKSLPCNTENMKGRLEVFISKNERKGAL